MVQAVAASHSSDAFDQAAQACVLPRSVWRELLYPVEAEFDYPGFFCATSALFAGAAGWAGYTQASVLLQPFLSSAWAVPSLAGVVAAAAGAAGVYLNAMLVSPTLRTAKSYASAARFLSKNEKTRGRAKETLKALRNRLGWFGNGIWIHARAELIQQAATLTEGQTNEAKEPMPGFMISAGVSTSFATAAEEAYREMPDVLRSYLRRTGHRYLISRTGGDLSRQEKKVKRWERDLYGRTHSDHVGATYNPVSKLIRASEYVLETNLSPTDHPAPDLEALIGQKWIQRGAASVKRSIRHETGHAINALLPSGHISSTYLFRQAYENDLVRQGGAAEVLKKGDGYLLDPEGSGKPTPEGRGETFSEVWAETSGGSTSGGSLWGRWIDCLIFGIKFRKAFIAALREGGRRPDVFLREVQAYTGAEGQRNPLDIEKWEKLSTLKEEEAAFWDRKAKETGLPEEAFASYKDGLKTSFKAFKTVYRDLRAVRQTYAALIELSAGRYQSDTRLPLDKIAQENFSELLSGLAGLPLYAKESDPKAETQPDIDKPLTQHLSELREEAVSSFLKKARFESTMQIFGRLGPTTEAEATQEQALRLLDRLEKQIRGLPLGGCQDTPQGAMTRKMVEEVMSHGAEVETTIADRKNPLLALGWFAARFKSFKTPDEQLASERKSFQALLSVRYRKWQDAHKPASPRPASPHL